MTMATTYKVIAPLVIAKNAEGADLYLYEGAAVPEGQSDEWVENHLRDGMIEVDASGGTSKRGRSSASSDE